jgi:hypothetical protein
LRRRSPAPAFDIGITTLKRIIPLKGGRYFRMPGTLDWLAEARNPWHQYKHNKLEKGFMTEAQQQAVGEEMEISMSWGS